MFPSGPNDVNVSVMLRWPKIEIIDCKETLFLFSGERERERYKHKDILQEHAGDEQNNGNNIYQIKKGNLTNSTSIRLTTN